MNLPNFASQSRWENYVWGPVALTLAILCISSHAAPADPRLHRRDRPARHPGSPQVMHLGSRR
jgi:hypothetical protein